MLELGAHSALPTGLGQSGNFPAHCDIAQFVAAEAEFAIDTTGPARQGTAIPQPNRTRVTGKHLQLDSSRMALFLAQVENIPGITLSHLADISEEIRMNAQESLVLDDRSNAFFYVLVAGAIDFYQRGELVSQFTEGQFIGEMLGLPSFVNTNLLIAQSDVVILKLHKDQFYELLADNVRLADKILEFI